uniref:Uncharacterized protein n=1 Tax=Ciona savignyi TaxID=51511 RepID=H2YHQ1_CIOSA
MRSFGIALTLVLAVGAAVGQRTTTLNTPTTVPTSVPEPEDPEYNEMLIQAQAMVETATRMFCKPSSNQEEDPVDMCLTGNFTQEECEGGKSCCYILDEETGEAICQKRRAETYVIARLEEMYETVVNGSQIKQAPLPVAQVVQCTFSNQPTQCAARNSLQFFQTVPPQTFVPFPQPTPSPRCFWYPWGGWSRCQGVCGAGVQTRIRRCQGCVPGTGACQGACTLKRGCANPIGQICAYWSGWSGYNQCSSSCGVGVRTRTRRCLGGTIGSFGCTGDSSQAISCNTGDNNSGTHLNWGFWSACSVTCGGGIRQRSRTHTCDGVSSEQDSCNTMMCCSKLEWSGWTPCSTTCGVGSQTRQRSDVCPNIPDEIQRQSCTLGTGTYGPWSPWGDCSSSCVGGSRVRSRAHSCRQALDSESEPCGVQGDFSEWSGAGPCSSTCPGGISRRTRSHSCSNVLQGDTVTCGQPGFFMEWSQWSSCSNTCGGQQTRLQRHTCGDDPNVERRPCGGSGVFGAWTGYTPCSQSCLGGTQTRRRFDVCTRDVETESQNCGVIGAWGGYSAWSQCTRTCGGGEQSRTRVHSCRKF